MSTLQEHIRRFWLENGSLFEEGPVLVAVSGGPDSMALAHVLHQNGHQIAIAHVNYHLRPESDAEEALVRKFAQKLEAPFHLHSVPTSTTKATGESTQQLARDVRYAFFQELLTTHGYSACATAHHQGDQVETILLSLLRGGHPGILNTIPAIRIPYIRPLLAATRKEVLAHLEEYQLTFATDASNLRPDYLRNRIRLEVLPAMEKVNPSAGNHLLEHCRATGDRNELVEFVLGNAKAKAVLEDGAEGGQHLHFGKSELPDRFLPLLVESFLRENGLLGNEIKEAKKLIGSSPGALKEFRGRKILRTKSGLLIPSQSGSRYKDSHLFEVAIPDPLPRFHTANTAHRLIEIQQLAGLPDVLRPPAGKHWLDPAALVPPVCIRNWRTGDRMRPLGMKGGKLLSDIFSELGTDVLERELTLVFEDAKGPFLIEGYRIADRVKVVDSTKAVVQIDIQKL